MVYSSRVRDQLDMKLHNRAMIWDLIFNLRPISRAQLAKITAMSPTSITRIVSELTAFGLLVEAPGSNVGVGRKATMIDIDRDAFFCVGLDVDVDSLQTCLLDLDNKPRAYLDRKLRGRRPTPEDLVETAHDMYLNMLSTVGFGPEKVRAVGVSVGGMVDLEQGAVVISPQMHWKNVPLKRIVESRFGLPTSLENDVKAAVYEEYARHQECRAENVAYLTIGSGIGAALMYNGKLLRGGNNAAGEIGHITVQPGGELCDCGRRGCLYTCLSERALIRRIRRLSAPTAGIDRWAKSFGEGEPWAIGLADEVGGYIAMALNHILCSYDPEIIIVGGKLMYNLPELLGVALAQKGYIYDALRTGARIVQSFSKKQDSVIGAAIMAKAAYLDDLLNEKTEVSNNR